MAKQALTLHQALEDVEARFLYNLPESELAAVDRLFFQIEQCWWYYEDFLADENDHLPHFKKLDLFAKQVFSHCPLLYSMTAQFDELFQGYTSYKSVIPSYGCILLDPSMTQVLMVQAYGGKTWTFPRGKVNENENPLICACRETFEETGYDPTVNCKEDDFLVWMEGKKLTKLYIGTNVSESTKFQTQVRKEIGDISFQPVESLAQGGGLKTWAVAPFYNALTRYIKKNRQKRGGAVGAKNGSKKNKQAQVVQQAKVAPHITKILERAATQNEKKHKNRQKDKGQGQGQDRPFHDGKQFDGRNNDTFADGNSIKPGDKGWSAQEMFKKNEALTGRKMDYDGNNNNFGSFHPRYVNYNNNNDQDRGGTADSNTDTNTDRSKNRNKKTVNVLFPRKFSFDMDAVRAAYMSALNVDNLFKGHKPNASTSNSTSKRNRTPKNRQ